jgi:hypothetical protein
MASKTTQRSSGKPAGKPGTKGQGRPGRKPVKPIKPALPWGMIALGTVVAVVAIVIIGYGVWSVQDAKKPFGERSSQQVTGMVNFRKTAAKQLTRNHKSGKLPYKQSPPVGGDHNGTWQNCEGAVYDKEIAKENAVHSMEHGAVWITYRPDLPKDQIAALAKKVKGEDYSLMSPYPGLDKPISLQAWGLQLKVDKASDERVDQFIRNFRHAATVEDTATCSQGITATGPEPKDAPAAPTTPQPGG